LPRFRAWIVCLVVVAALTSAGVALSKGVTTTTCGRDRCRTVTDGISGIATLSGRVAAPRSGRFYTVSLRTELNGRPVGWKIVFEAKRQIVRAVDARALFPGHPLGTAHTRRSTAVLQGGPRSRTDAIGTPHESLRANPSDGRRIGFSDRHPEGAFPDKQRRVVELSSVAIRSFYLSATISRRADARGMACRSLSHSFGASPGSATGSATMCAHSVRMFASVSRG
jgi:hypothetical protein